MFRTKEGSVYMGYVADDYLKCNFGKKPSPKPSPQPYIPPQPRPQPQQQRCGRWMVRNGGPGNACRDGWDYTASDNTFCSITGADCQSICCTTQVYY